MINAFGISRTRDDAGRIVRQDIRDYTMCITSMAGGGYETMQILVLEVYEDYSGSIKGENGASRKGGMAAEA